MREGRVGLGAVPERRDRQCQERREEPIHITPIAHRRHVGDEERADPIGIAEREGHGDLAPHAVTEQGHPRHALFVEQHEDVLGHLLVTHAVGVGGASVVAQIDDQDPVFDRQAPGHRAPVTGRAEKTREDNERHPGPEVLVVEREGHQRGSLSALR